MRAQFYHALAPPTVLDSLRNALAGIGLYAQGRAEGSALVDALKRRRLVATSSFRPEPRLRSFARRDGSAAAFFLVNDWLRSDVDSARDELDLMIYAEAGDCDALATAVGRAVGVRFRPQTFGDCAYAERCAAVMTGLSPNGRLLLDPEVRRAADAAVDESFRDAWRSPTPADRTRPEAYAVRQGLWLEWLTYSALSHHSSLGWHGVMAAGSELDVVAVLHENVVLAECKDASLGQNDFVVAAHKARRVSADLLLLVTTRDLHPNVLAAIEQHESDEDADPIPCAVLLVTAGSGDALRLKLRDELADLASHGVKNWLSGRRITMAQPDYFATSGDW